MLDDLKPNTSALEWRTPLSTRILDNVMRLAFAMLAALIACALLSGLILNTMNQQSGSIGLLALFPLAIVIGCLVFLGIARSRPHRISLHENAIRIGGRWSRRWLLYEELQLLKLIVPEKTIGRNTLLSIQTTKKRIIKIWLGERDAADCLNSLQQLCADLPAIGTHGEILTVNDGGLTEDGRQLVKADFARKARGALITAVVCALIGSLILIAAANSTGGTGVKLWSRGGLLLLVSVGMIGVYITNRRRAQGL